MKKLLALMLATMLVLSLFAGCASKEAEETSGGEAVEEGTKTEDKNDEEAVEVEEQKTFKLVGKKEPLAPDWNEMKVFTDLESKTGVHIDWTLIPTSDWEIKRSLVVQDGDIEGYFAAPYTDYDLVNLANEGYFIPLDDLIEEYAPNISKLFERAPYLKALVTHEDGHIYSLPAAEELALGHARNFVSINQTWLDDLGIATPNNAAEFKEALIAIRDNDCNGNGDTTDEIPFAFLNMFWCSDIGDLMAPFGIADNGEHIVVQDGQVVFTANQDAYKEALIYFADLYSENLIDPEAFTASNEFQLMFAKGQSNTLGSYIWWETAEIAGEYKDDYQLMLPWKNTEGVRVTGRSNDKDGGKGAFMITENCSDPVALIKWIDNIYDPYTAALFHWGDLLEENADGILQPKELEEGINAGELRQQTAPNGIGVILREDFETVVFAEPRAKERMGQIKEFYEPYMPKDNFPKAHMPFTDGENEVISEIEPTIYDYVREMRAKFIIGGVTNEEWDEFVAQLDSMGLQDLMDIYKAAYARYLEKM